MKTLRVLVADDSEFMRATYKKIVETQKHLRIVAIACDGQEAVSQAEATKPDVAILDFRMPKLSGLEAASQILVSRPGTGIIMVSSYDDPQYFVELLKCGAGGKAYLLKTSIHDFNVLIRAVEGVARGETILDPFFTEDLPEGTEEH